MNKAKLNRNKLVKIKGFTLIEMLVVVAIMATLAAIIAPNLLRRASDAQVTRVSTDIQSISSALDMYKLDNFIYPSADQGLMALIEKPGGTPEPKNWKGYLKGSDAPKDPWGNEYYYEYPGQHGAFDVYSLGADGQPGGEDADADIGNWTGN